MSCSETLSKLALLDRATPETKDLVSTAYEQGYDAGCKQAPIFNIKGKLSTINFPARTKIVKFLITFPFWLVFVGSGLIIVPIIIQTAWLLRQLIWWAFDRPYPTANISCSVGKPCQRNWLHWRRKWVPYVGWEEATYFTYQLQCWFPEE